MKNIRIIVASLIVLLGGMLNAGFVIADEQTGNQVVNINTANAEALSAALKGIGIKKAQAIVAYREQYGDFKTLGELAEVKGIGTGTLAKNESVIVLE